MLDIQAVFIDRDGTLGGSDTVIYPGDFELFPGVQDSINLLKANHLLVFSFTNQPGIAIGEATVDQFDYELKSFGFNKVYICPHRHDEGCICRKPSVGMLKKAAEENALDLSRCAVIGDRWTDLLAADDAGCLKILVKTGSGQEACDKYINKQYFGRWGQVHPDFIAEDLNEAISWILREG
ncbi:MAG: HAD-IIIA family hydrolase [Mesobacillus sp.]|uniref:D,D-heptose 1,7-bisphosphate phosphatase n=1 Tax=Mesobacillus jeotgali TaxID=129985 RepID=A0ABY9VPT3_9BACI|nr:HAD-IIIA family hydrolase [Mesobacillus jeotgali]WNF24670.1 HAD-IIIA family hydrolase [Mesobacillus jeotgali]